MLNLWLDKRAVATLSVRKKKKIGVTFDDTQDG